MPYAIIKEYSQKYFQPKINKKIWNIQPRTENKKRDRVRNERKAQTRA